MRCSSRENPIPTHPLAPATRHKHAVLALTFEQPFLVIVDEHGKRAARAVFQAFQSGIVKLLLRFNFLQCRQRARRQPGMHLVLGEGGLAVVRAHAVQDLDGDVCV